MRTLLLLILLFIIYWWARRALTRGSPRENQRKRHQNKVSEADEEAERVIACRHCGIHIPESEGVREGKDFFCSEAHRRLGVKR